MTINNYIHTNFYTSQHTLTMCIQFQKSQKLNIGYSILQATLKQPPKTHTLIVYPPSFKNK